MTALAAHGTHRKPHWYQRALTRLRSARDSRRQRKADTAARDDAYAATLHEINEDRQTGTQPAVTDGFNQPPAAVQPDQDVPGLEHLDEGQYSDDTHAFSRYVDGGQE